MENSWILSSEEIVKNCSAFIAETVHDAGLQKVVIGLSGGIDSAVSAALAVKALGKDNVFGVCMPYRLSNPSSLSDGIKVAENLGIDYETRDISAMVDAFLIELPDDAPVRRGNVMARCRMIVLYDVSARDKSLVLGTGNRTETLLGYATLHGDAAFALNPLEDLYKMEVRAVAKYLGLPKGVITKAPSADLWEGQTDEQELGFSYDDADNLLHLIIDEGLGDRQLESLGFSSITIEAVRNKMIASAFKWKPVPSAKFPCRLMPEL
jgi:NAD+ synthase